MGGVLILLTLSVLIGFLLGGRFSWLGIGAVGIALALLSAVVLHRQGFGALSGIAVIVACLTVNQVSYLVGWLAASRHNPFQDYADSKPSRGRDKQVEHKS
jgi:hypothetical protein